MLPSARTARSHPKPIHSFGPKRRVPAVLRINRETTLISNSHVNSPIAAPDTTGPLCSGPPSIFAILHLSCSASLSTRVHSAVGWSGPVRPVTPARAAHQAHIPRHGLNGRARVSSNGRELREPGAPREKGQDRSAWLTRTPPTHTDCIKSTFRPSSICPPQAARKCHFLGRNQATRG